MSLCSVLPQEAGFAARGSSRHHQGPGPPAHAHHQGEPTATAHPGSWWPAAHHTPGGTVTGRPQALCVCQVLAGTTAPSRWGRRARRPELPLHVQKVRGGRPGL